MDITIDNDVKISYFKAIDRENIVCNVSHKFDRKTDTTLVSRDIDSYNSNTCDIDSSGVANKHIDINGIIERNWTKVTLENPTVFNGSKFRFHSHTLEKDRILKINIGVTCYKDFIGTNNNPDFLTLAKRCNVENLTDFLAHPLGVGSMMVTCDNFAVFIRRSMSCAESPGLWCRAGGHPEPANIFGPVSASDIDLSTADAAAVRQEIIAAVLDEISDEINVPHVSCGKPRLMGISFNRLAGDKPTLEFLVRCSLTKAEVETKYRKGTQPEAYESTDIRFIHRDGVKNLGRAHINWDDVTGKVDSQVNQHVTDGRVQVNVDDVTNKVESQVNQHVTDDIDKVQVNKDVTGKVHIPVNEHATVGIDRFQVNRDDVTGKVHIQVNEHVTDNSIGRIQVNKDDVTGKVGAQSEYSTASKSEIDDKSGNVDESNAVTRNIVRVNRNVTDKISVSLNNDVTDKIGRSDMEDFWDNLTPCGKAAICLYTLWETI